MKHNKRTGGIFTEISCTMSCLFQLRESTSDVWDKWTKMA